MHQIVGGEGLLLVCTQRPLFCPFGFDGENVEQTLVKRTLVVCGLLRPAGHEPGRLRRFRRQVRAAHICSRVEPLRVRRHSAYDDTNRTPTHGRTVRAGCVASSLDLHVWRSAAGREPTRRRTTSRPPSLKFFSEFLQAAEINPGPRVTAFTFAAGELPMKEVNAWQGEGPGLSLSWRPS